MTELSKLGDVDNPEFSKNESIEAALNEVFVDISEKLKQKDPQFISGIQKFNDRYNGIKSDAVLASSFHKFGKFDTGKSTCLRAESVRHGICIPIQASAAGRRKYGTRGRPFFSLKDDHQNIRGD